MDKTKRATELSARPIHSYAQRHRVRCLSPEQAMEYQDSFEPVHRHTSAVKATESEPRGRPQPRRIREKARVRED